MTIERTLAKVFALDDAAWRRHANPWSVALRNTVLPVLVLGFFSRLWLGWWSVVPVALALLWTWLNPRIFREPATFDHWASKAVFGERVWLNRDRVPVPANHRRVPNILSAVAGAGILVVFWGTLSFDLWPILFGMALVYCGKLWYLDRMVWIWEEMRDATPEYGGWEHSPAENA